MNTSTPTRRVLLSILGVLCFLAPQAAFFFVILKHDHLVIFYQYIADHFAILHQYIVAVLVLLLLGMYFSMALGIGAFISMIGQTVFDLAILRKEHSDGVIHPVIFWSSFAIVCIVGTQMLIASHPRLLDAAFR